MAHATRGRLPIRPDMLILSASVGDIARRMLADACRRVVFAVEWRPLERPCTVCKGVTHVEPSEGNRASAAKAG